MHRVRALSLNIWNRSGPWTDRLELIRAGLKALAPDVVGLQEVVVDGQGSQAEEIAHGFGYEIAYGKASTYDDGALFGNAVLSKYPIVAHENRELPSPGTSQRAAILARLDTPAGVLPFASTHLAWKFTEGMIREQQVRALAKFIDGARAGSDLPALVVGDFNTRPDATEIRFMMGLHALEGASTHFNDCFEVAGIGSPFTFDPRNNPHAGLTYELPRRIDYVFVAGPDDHGRGVPVSARVVFDEVRQKRDQRYAASDHYGVLAEIDF
ncbi:MAG: endonuclease/exonuclease/phosphatase family protein [Polyangiaceae bacterium]